MHLVGRGLLFPLPRFAVSYAVLLTCLFYKNVCKKMRLKLTKSCKNLKTILRILRKS